MPIPNPPPTPSRNDPATFSARMDAYLAWLSTQAVPEINTIAINAAVGIYQEGTFTPAVRGTTTAGTATYLAQVGRFTRIGNRVLFDFVVEWSGHTGTGNMEIIGLPVASAAGSRAIFSVVSQNVLLSANNILGARNLAGTSVVQLVQTPTGGNAAVANVPMDAAGEIVVSGVYQA